MDPNPWTGLEPRPVVAAAARDERGGTASLPRGGAAGAAAALAIVAAVAALADGGDARQVAVTTADGSPSAAAAATVAGSALVVEVAGAVLRPGVYRLPSGSRVGDAIAAAGGYGPAVDVTAADRVLNLAAPLRDGEEVRVPARGEGGAAATATTEPPGAPGLLDLNRASAAELEELPGIGPTTAARIVEAREERPFASVEELLERGVVGPALLERIRGLVTAVP